ncbi:MAG: beta-propeller domain-containing protein [Patescibacteria group bacterium]|jgi:uncharacterized secreted protein with C-terminal beta-propeller domain
MKHKLLITLLIGGVLLLTFSNLAVLYFYKIKPADNTINSNNNNSATALTETNTQLTAFTSIDDFKAYLAKATAINAASSFDVQSSFAESVTFDANTTSTGATTDDLALGSAEQVKQTVERVSETNVQVTGVDEPDMVKTDGTNLFLSELYSTYPYYQRSVTGENATKVITTLPPTNPVLASTITDSGNLLLNDNTLIVLSNQVITAYDVANPATPKQVWQMKLAEQTEYESARLANNTLYLITRSVINESKPCPFTPATLAEKNIEVNCFDIYHPIVATETDTTFTVLKINPSTGETQKKLSFVGSPNNIVLYQSADNLYLTTAFPADMAMLIVDFLNATVIDLLPDDVTKHLQQVAGYDLSAATKMMELGTILNKYTNSLSSAERLTLETELTNRGQDFFTAHQRELVTTALTKVQLTDLTITATANVPGTLLNQFSLDEYQGNLRLATTIGGSNVNDLFDLPSGQIEQTNDLYVLDTNLQQLGSVENLGNDEKIYSARFLGNKGYLVTFKQTDPFFVFDLTNPAAPKKVGELKIPGYSSYLHPITDTLVLGVGKEAGAVKLSLFDVTDPANPVEADHYNLSEYSSDLLTNHHGFLLDSKQQVFFIPGTKGGYVFSYANNKLELKKALSDINSKRALYINDYLYIISAYNITVLSETDWSQVGQFELSLE